MPKSNKKCFVIMPFTSPSGYDDNHFKRVYEYIIKPACEKAGFEPVISWETAKTNLIALEILKNIVEFDMAICDISSRNPNVFYELGLRHAFNKKTVLLKDKRTETPFDISSLRYTEYSETLRVDEVENTVEQVARSLTDTYEAENNDGNSLVQLLAIDEAKLPARREISEDTSLIISEIKNIKSLLMETRSNYSRRHIYTAGLKDEDSLFRINSVPELSSWDGFLHKDKNDGYATIVDPLKEQNINVVQTKIIKKK